MLQLVYVVDGQLQIVYFRLIFVSFLVIIDFCIG